MLVGVILIVQMMTGEGTTRWATSLSDNGEELANRT